MSIPGGIENAPEFNAQTIFKDRNTSHEYANHRHAYSEEVFQVISDYCRESVQDLNLAVDVGCGPGNSTVGFTKHFKQVIGVDISETQIAQAPTNIPNCKFKVGSATDLDFLESGSVDLFACGLAFNLMPQKEVFAEADRVLRPGGSIAIFCYGVATCDNKRMDEVLQWMYNYVIPKGGSKLVEVLELEKDLELPYPGWIRRDGIVVPHKTTPAGIMAICRVLGRFMRENGYDDKEYVTNMEARMTEALKDIRKDPKADGDVFELQFPAAIVMGHKPL